MSYHKVGSGAARGGSGKTGGHAVVLGGSLAGLLAARVLAHHFDRVTVVERDAYPSDTAVRKGVPQASHVHALMRRGQQVIEELFPGLLGELLADGAHLVDVPGEVAWLTPAGWGARFPSDLHIIGFTRPLLDLHVRRRLAYDPRVRILEETETLRLLPGGGDGGVGGVRCRPRRAGSAEEELRADLVVDATGRGSRAPRWLEELGSEAPEETVVNGFLGYASRLYRVPAGFASDWKGAYVQLAPPERTRGGIMLPVEGGRWLVTLLGGGRHYPPADEEGFLEFARSLPSPIIYDAIKGAEPLTPIRSHRATENRRRHYERLRRQPANFLVTGDAACAFNPVYGQGMTAAALGALALDETLREQRRRYADGETDGLARRFQRRLAKANAAPWLLATGEDFRYREVEGSTPTLLTRLTHRYLDSVVCLATRDEVVRRVLLEIMHMLKTPPSLFHPRVSLRVLARTLGLTPRPAASKIETHGSPLRTELIGR
jgi:2-polyprenyl-6-methoxyphenol hydroxylase-like FAD-dependent oxidoreductase